MRAYNRLDINTFEEMVNYVKTNYSSRPRAATKEYKRLFTLCKGRGLSLKEVLDEAFGKAISKHSIYDFLKTEEDFKNYVKSIYGERRPVSKDKEYPRLAALGESRGFDFYKIVIELYGKKKNHNKKDLDTFEDLAEEAKRIFGDKRPGIKTEGYSNFQALCNNRGFGIKEILDHVYGVSEISKRFSGDIFSIKTLEEAEEFIKENSELLKDEKNRKHAMNRFRLQGVRQTSLNKKFPKKEEVKLIDEMLKKKNGKELLAKYFRKTFKTRLSSYSKDYARLDGILKRRGISISEIQDLAFGEIKKPNIELMDMNTDIIKQKLFG